MMKDFTPEIVPPGSGPRTPGQILLLPLSHKSGALAIEHRYSVDHEPHGQPASSDLQGLQRQLQATSERLDSVLCSMSEGLAMFDREWRTTYVNDQAARTLGVPAKQLIGRRLSEVLPGAADSSLFQAFRRSVESGAALHFGEFYPDPLNKWLDCHCYPADEGLSVYFRDVTDRQEYLNAILESDDRARLGMQVARLALADVDYESGLIHLSAEAAKLFGLAQAATNVPRSAIHATFHPADRADVERRMAESLDPAGIGWFTMDHRVLWPGGEVRWLRVRKQVYFSGSGKDRRPQRAMLAAFDVTLERNAAERVRESEVRFRTLAESLPELVWEADSKGIKLYCNRRYFEYSGKDSIQAIDRHWHHLLHPEDRDATTRRWQHSLMTGEPYLAEYRLRRADGEFRYFLARALPVRNPQGQIERWIGSSTDIHEQKMAEETLRRSEMVAAAGKLAASIAHEINNPLSAVTNLLFLIDQDADLKPETRAYLASAQEELARVAEITTQSLRFHKQSTEAAPTRIDELLDSILRFYQRRILNAGLDIVRDYRPTDPIICRAGDLRQALANVICNAMDATPGGGRVVIRLRRSHHWTTPEQRGVRITIADHGEGISKDHLTRVFQAFFSTKGITSTGLGLWITEDLITRCGGAISVYSSTRPGRSGSVFSIFLPS